MRHANFLTCWKYLCTITCKINVTPKDVYLPISKVYIHFILAESIYLPIIPNTSQICYCGQISLQSAVVDGSFSANLTLLGVTFILLSMAQRSY